MVGTAPAPLPVGSVSRFVQEGLGSGHRTGRVLAVFQRACALRMSGGQVLALVEPRIGDGPLSVVLGAGGGGWLTGLEAGDAVQWDGERLRLGSWSLALTSAPTWEPHPDWERLRARREVLSGRLPDLRTLAQAAAPPGSLLALLSPLPDSAQGAVLSAAAGALPALQAGWRGDRTQLRRAASRLAGLGGGLTPAGDDFLCGVLLWAWLAHPSPQRWGEALLAEAAPRTTAYSAAFLRAAAQGGCSAAWHRLLAALERGSSEELAAAVPGVLAHGHTSGADTLAGFLWLGGNDKAGVIAKG